MKRIRHTPLRVHTSAQRRGRAPRSNRAGLSLLEVVLAVSIFVMSMAALYELMSIGHRNSLDSRLQTQAILRAESKLSEVVGNPSLLQSVSDMPFEEDTLTGAPGQWSWSLLVSTSPVDPVLLQLELTVRHSTSSGQENATFTLRRLVRDPQALADLQADQAAAEEEAAAAAGQE